MIRGVGHDLDAHEKTITKASECWNIWAWTQWIWRVSASKNMPSTATCAGGSASWLNTPRHVENLIAEQESLHRLGYRHKVELIGRTDMHRVVGSDRYLGGLTDEGSGHLHPLNLALGEARVAQQLGVRLYQNSAATRIE